MSSADWIYDKVAGKWFGWNEKAKCWVYEDGTRVPSNRVPSNRVPPSRQATSAGGTSTSSSKRPVPRQQYTSREEEVVGASALSLDSKLKDMRLRDVAENPLATDSSVQQWVADDRAGVRSQWKVWPSQQLTDRNAPQSRTYRRKFIRGDGGDGSSGGDRRFAGYVRSRNPRNDFKFGRVVEILYVSPPARTESTVTRLTPTSNNTDGSAIRARTRRFVVIVGPTETSTSFTALPINTYNSRGVAPSQVIKSHHCIIYTSSRQPPRPPAAQRDELPRRLPNGHLETPMREPPIRVETYDRAQALDPLSRLDFCDLYDFDFNIPVHIFGRVHESSRANLQLHYTTIWRDIQLSVGQDLSAGRTQDAPPALPGPSPSRGTYTEAQMRDRVKELQDFAVDHRLTRPRISQSLLDSFMADSQTFINYETQVRQRWQLELAAQEEESEEEESDDDDSDDDE